jgi:hypothetical protein
MESQAMRDLLWRVCFQRKIWPHHVTGDAKYGTTEIIVAIEDAGIRAYVPLTDFAHRTDFYGQDDFIFDSERDEYRCPEGQIFRRYATKRTEGVVAYRGEATICNACPVKVKCTTSDHGRKVQRSFYRRCGVTTPRSRTGRRSARGRSGSNRSLPGRRSGTASVGCDSEAC